eukprot:1065691-Prymnesium_polylepis.1
MGGAAKRRNRSRQPKRVRPNSNRRLEGTFMTELVYIASQLNEQRAHSNRVSRGGHVHLVRSMLDTGAPARGSARSRAVPACLSPPPRRDRWVCRVRPSRDWTRGACGRVSSAPPSPVHRLGARLALPDTPETVAQPNAHRRCSTDTHN